MEGFDPKASFGLEASQHYVASETRGDEAETVAFLAELAGGRDALEFALGAGRVALPLISAGVRVDGIEQSRHMVDRLREKPGGADVNVVIGDMASVEMGRSYGLVYLVYNTIGNLVTQEGQVECFQNAARHLAEDGVFVLECRVPTAPSRPGLRYVDAERVAADEVALDLGRYDPITQVLDLSHVHITGASVRLSPISLRLAHPPEFDLMARIAGLQLRHRWAGWKREPFIATSWRHVSVYAPIAGAGPTEPQRNLPWPGSRAARRGRRADPRSPQPSRTTSLAVDDPVDSDKFRFDAGTSIPRAVPPDPKCAETAHVTAAVLAGSLLTNRPKQ